MRRRGLVTLALSVAILWPVMLARAQRSGPVIGILGSSTANDYGPMVAVFRKGLSEAGYFEGSRVRICVGR
jgi:putative tryptophan/tyrosine transport system substrate-binding protein